MQVFIFSYKITLIYGFFGVILGKPLLQFNSMGEFTILQFSDLHFGIDESNDHATEEIIKSLVGLVEPDLVSITGDVISGEQYSLKSHPPNFSRQNWEKMSEIFLSLHQPYMYVLGNHDSLGDINSREELMMLDMTNIYSLSNFSKGISGASNYVNFIYPHGNLQKPAVVIWAFDTGELGCGGQKWGYGCIEKDQIEWYLKNTEPHIQNDTFHIAFAHVPVIELLNISNSEFYGNLSGLLDCPRVNTGAVQAFLSTKTMKNLFFGHLHSDDIGGWYEGIEMTVTLKAKTGGARVIKLKQNHDASIILNHYEIDTSGKLNNNKTLHTREGILQTECPIPNYQYLIEEAKKEEEKARKWREIFRILSIAAIPIIIIILWLWFKKIWKNRNITDLEMANLKANIDADS